jgi:hypothetical protein
MIPGWLITGLAAALLYLGVAHAFRIPDWIQIAGALTLLAVALAIPARRT